MSFGDRFGSFPFASAWDSRSRGFVTERLLNAMPSRGQSTCHLSISLTCARKVQADIMVGGYMEWHAAAESNSFEPM